MQGFLSRRGRACEGWPPTVAAGSFGGRGERGEDDSTARSGEQALGAARAAALPTGVACRPSLRSYDVRLPEITVDLNRGSLGDAWWVSFGEQKRVSSGERQGSAKIKYLSEAFLEANNSPNATDLRAQIQDRVIAASDQRCNLYMTYLKRVSTYENGIFGTLTTILGGAGAIVTGENSARVLSGLAGMSSGTRAELNQALFESVATSIITPGIEKARSEFLVEIMKKRKDPLLAIGVYTIQGAIADAIKYHGLCSLDQVINSAQKSLQAPKAVGMPELIQTLKAYEAARSEIFPKPAK